ncbi:alpha/beta hydrolase [Paenibacillus sp. PL91]|uniref:alpha/beta hydrolase n=1 Tax=Paenibacillus sp. PL91 TaxID=2729538 RepID=UPI00145EC477|nr:alpha/beta fold hydrolase [Paenibacillus sp. PL91]MBC9200475.1 alpha/beta fold hydrolase [Paenibacillus sp. PL91]
MGAVLWLLASLLIIVALLAALVWQMGARSQNPRKLANADEPDVDTQWQSLSFMSNGSKLEGWLLHPAAPNTDLKNGQIPLIVVAHGWGSNRTRVLRYTRPLYEAGFAVFMYDARSHGNSDSISAPSALMFRDDVRAAIETAKQLPGIDPDRIAVLGHSLGGFGALLALDQGVQVRAVVTDSMPVRFETMMKSELRRKKLPLFPLAYLIPMIWLIRARISRAEFREASIPLVLSRHAGSSEEGRTPVMMIHSNGDDFISAEDLRELKEQLPKGMIDTLFVSTKGHSTSEQEPAFWEKVIPFLQEKVVNASPKKEACGTGLQATRENI